MIKALLSKVHIILKQTQPGYQHQCSLSNHLIKRFNFLLYMMKIRCLFHGQSKQCPKIKKERSNFDFYNPTHNKRIAPSPLTNEGAKCALSSEGFILGNLSLYAHTSHHFCFLLPSIVCSYLYTLFSSVSFDGSRNKKREDINSFLFCFLF